MEGFGDPSRERKCPLGGSSTQKFYLGDPLNASQQETRGYRNWGTIQKGRRAKNSQGKMEQRGGLTSR